MNRNDSQNTQAPIFYLVALLGILLGVASILLFVQHQSMKLLEQERHIWQQSFENEQLEKNALEDELANYKTLVADLQNQINILVEEQVNLDSELERLTIENADLKNQLTLVDANVQQCELAKVQNEILKNMVTELQANQSEVSDLVTVEEEKGVLQSTLTFFGGIIAAGFTWLMRKLVL